MFKTKEYFPNPQDCPNQCVKDNDPVNPIYLYDNSFWIECIPGEHQTYYYTMMGNVEETSLDLEELEQWLYEVTRNF